MGNEFYWEIILCTCKGTCLCEVYLYGSAFWVSMCIIAYAGIVLCARLYMCADTYTIQGTLAVHIFQWQAALLHSLGPLCFRYGLWPCLTLLSREFTLDGEHSHKLLRKGMESQSYTFPSVSLAFTDTLTRYRMFSSEACKHLLLRGPWLGSSVAISEMIPQYSLCPCLSGRTAWHMSFSSWLGLLGWPFYFLIFHICVLPESMYVYCVL